MKRIYLVMSVVCMLALVIAATWSQVSAAGNGLTRTTWPTEENPGFPFYARALDNSEMVAFIFYREPGCVPADFNLLVFYDAPAAFSCPHTVHGALLWENEVYVGAPKLIHSTGNGAVPIWFVSVEVANQAVQDDVLTIGELAGLDGLLIGYADQFNEELHPSPDPPELGGGGNPNPIVIVDAHGQLEDGRAFDMHTSATNGEYFTGIRFR